MHHKEYNQILTKTEKKTSKITYLPTFSMNFSLPSNLKLFPQFCTKVEMKVQPELTKKSISADFLKFQ